jgi:non-specific protein-tyrosine kinase
MAARSEEDTELHLRDFVRVLWVRKWIILIATVVMVAAAYGFSERQASVYEATAQFRVVASVDPTVAQGSRAVQVSPESEIEVLQSAPVVERVRAALGGNAPPITAESVSGTEFVTVKAESTDPEAAAAIPNAYVDAYRDYRRQQTVDSITPVRDQFQARFDEIQVEVDGLTAQLAEISPLLEPQTFADLTDRRSAALSRQVPIRAEVDRLNTQLDVGVTGGVREGSPAEVPTEPSRPTPVRNALLALPIGLAFGIALVFLFEHLDDSIKSKDDLQAATGPDLPILGLIPAVPWRDRRQAHMITLESPSSPPSEAYRSLRTGVQFLGIDDPLNCLQVTSALAGEGKTTTVTNLALVLARTRERPVVVVDCDLRRPRLHEFFGLDNSIGFTSVLQGEVPISAALRPFHGEPGLSALLSGPIPSDPSELLASRRAAEVLASLRADGTLVLLDTPPVLPVTDALVVSRYVDATLVVTTSGVTTKRQVQRALELLDQVGALVLGTILNKAPRGAGGYGYGYRGYYGPDKVKVRSDMRSHVARNHNDDETTARR